MLLTEQCLQVKLHLSVRITVPRIGSLVRNRIVRIPQAARYKKEDVFIGFRWTLLLVVTFWQTILLKRNVALLYHGDCWLQVIKRDESAMNANQLHSFMKVSPIFLDRHEHRHKMDVQVLLRSKSSDPETESRYSLQNDLLFITNLNPNFSASSLSKSSSNDRKYRNNMPEHGSRMVNYQPIYDAALC